MMIDKIIKFRDKHPSFFIFLFITIAIVAIAFFIEFIIVITGVSPGENKSTGVIVALFFIITIWANSLRQGTGSINFKYVSKKDKIKNHSFFIILCIIYLSVLFFNANIFITSIVLTVLPLLHILFFPKSMS